MNWKRQKCRMIGHHWTMKQWGGDSGVSILVCFRCFPHPDSTRRIATPPKVSTLLSGQEM